MKRKELVRFVAARAIRCADHLPPERQADLYSGLALILEGADREVAQRTAFHLREAQSHQARMQELLQSIP